MAETKSSAEAKPEEVTLTNVSRRPLLMRLPGKTLRLGPGDRHTVPKSLLATAELHRMCEQRFVVVSPVPEPKLQEALATRHGPTAPAEEVQPDVQAATDQPNEEEARPEPAGL